MQNYIPAILTVCFLLALGGCSDSQPEGPAPGLIGEVEAETDPQESFAPVEDETGIEEMLQLREPWSGDLDGMAARRVIRLLTVYSPGRYYIEGNGKESGVVKEMASSFEKFINKRLDKRTLRVHVVIIPLPRGQLIPALLAGYGDIVSAGLTITDQREKQYDFSIPTTKPVSEVLVSGPSAPDVETIDQLAGQTIYVREGSSYRESVETLNRDFAERGLPPVHIELVSAYLEDDDLIEMVDRGLLPWIIVDSYKPQLWENVFDNVEVHRNIVLRESGEIAWAFRKESPQLAAAVNEFVKTHREGTLFGNVLVKRYLEDFDWAANALGNDDYQRFLDMEHVFAKYGAQYEVDYLLAAAQGFQESRLDQNARGKTGAVGVMQILPSTAHDKNVDIADIHELEPNIEAGIKYLAYLRERYFPEPEVDRLNGTLLALAAYNAGPRRMINLRDKTKAMGYDPDVWFDNVEIVAAKQIGRETVQYVANIFKYYLAYRFTAEQQARQLEARQRAGLDRTEAL